MTFLFFFGAVNIVLRSIFLLCMIYGLLRFGKTLTIGQRAGMGFAGGAALMTIPSTWTYHFNRPETTPFDGWATSILMLGCIVFFMATMRRHQMHARRNAEAVEQSRKHLTDRGKL
jgi:hypothetical protein